MSHLAYFRVSTAGQSIESQRDALRATAGGAAIFDKEFIDHGISGATLAAQRPGFAALLAYAREGDTVFVYAVDRLGRDAIDVQQTVRDLIDRGVTVHVHGLGTISKGAGELVLAVLAQVAAMEKARIAERTEAGRSTAKERLGRGEKTQNGKASMGRPFEKDPDEVIAWMKANAKTQQATADHFGLGLSTVKRYCRVQRTGSVKLFPKGTP